MSEKEEEEQAVEEKKEEKEEEERCSICSKPPNTFNSQGWDRLKLGTWNSFPVTIRVAGAKPHKLSSTASQNVIPGSQIRNMEAGI